MSSAIRLIVASGALALVAGTATGAVVTLEDRNSVVNLDNASSAGMTDWVVDGTDQLFQQWFWFRVDGEDTQERPINALPLTGNVLTDTNTFVDPRPDNLALQYSGAGFTIEPSFQLRGGNAGSGRSDIGEQISIHNNRTTPLHITFIQYCDFDLNGSAGADVGEILAPLFNTVRQSEAGFALTETVITPGPNHFELNIFPVTRDNLDDTDIDNLNDFAGPLGPGDVTWAFQWDFVIDPNGSVLISKDKSIVPAPGTAAALLLGAAGLGRRRRR